jgi:SAM-dependent methyltransferase
MKKNPFNKSYDVPVDYPVYRDATEFDLAQDRIRCVLDFIRDHQVRSVLEIGFFPGLIGRIIKDTYPDIRLHGVGKANGKDLAKDFPWYDALSPAEFDPFYGPVELPSLQESFDLVLATEVIEHLVDPMVMLRFARGALRDGGHLIVSTPNVSSFGAIGRLLKGRSNHESLAYSIIFARNDWRAHIRLYDRSELAFLGTQAGLTGISHRYYLSAALFHERHQGLHWWLRFLFSAIPWFREDQIMIYRTAPLPSPG